MLSTTAKSVVVGSVNGAEEIGASATSAISNSARGLIKGTSEVGGDVAGVARSAAEGAVSTSKNLAVSLEDAAAGVASGAIKATHEVGSDLGNTAKSVGRGQRQRRGRDRRQRDVGHIQQRAGTYQGRF